MNINKENYEIYILDYYEGTLSKSKAQELFAFLEANPDIKEEFDNFENISLIDETSIKYDFKESLKKANTSSATIINLDNYKEFFIANIEGDLSISQQKQLEIFLLRHPFLNNEYHLFNIAKLSPDTSIVFENKRQLKKFSVFNLPINKKLIYQTASIAASLLLFASITTYFYSSKNINNKNVTAINTNKTSTFVKPITKSTKVITNNVKNNNVFASNANIKVVKHQNTSEKIIQNKVRETNEIQLLASISLKEINTNSTVSIDEEPRNYYTSLNNLLAFAEDPINDNVAESTTGNKKTRRFKIDPNLLKDHPLAQAGGFLKNIAVVGYDKIEELGAAAKSNYLAFEEKVRRK